MVALVFCECKRDARCKFLRHITSSIFVWSWGWSRSQVGVGVHVFPFQCQHQHIKVHLHRLLLALLVDEPHCTVAWDARTKSRHLQHSVDQGLQHSHQRHLQCKPQPQRQPQYQHQPQCWLSHLLLHARIMFYAPRNIRPRSVLLKHISHWIDVIAKKKMTYKVPGLAI